MRRKRKQLMTESGTAEEPFVTANDIKKLTPEEYVAMRHDPEQSELPPKTTFKDSGSRTEFGTGAVRDAQEGKGRMELLPIRALFEVAKIMEEGAKKYAAHNWRKGIPLSRFMDSGMRHAFKYLRGDRDEPHDAMACWNFLCLIETRMMIEEGLLPESLNDLIFNPLNVDDNPLGIQETQPGSGYIQPKEPTSIEDVGKTVDAVMEELGNGTTK
jgi:hypothetical protein